MRRTSLLLTNNINCKYCSRIIRGSYPLIADGACRCVRVLLRSSEMESDMVRTLGKQSIPLPRRSEPLGKHSFGLDMIFLLKCPIYSPRANLLSSPTSHPSKFTLLFCATSLLSIKYHSKKCLPSRQAITSLYV